MIDGNSFFLALLKKKHTKRLLKLEEIMTTQQKIIFGNLLDYEYFSKHYKLFAIDLSKENDLENPGLKQQINFIGRIEEDNATMFFINGKWKEKTSEFSQNAVTAVWLSLVLWHIYNGNSKNCKFN